MTRSQHSDQPTHRDTSPLSLPKGGAVPSRDALLTERIFDAVARIEANTDDTSTVSQMLGVAEQTLHAVGFANQREILRGKTEAFCRRIPAGYEMATAVALETLAWYQLRHSTDTYHAATLYMERAAKLCPLDSQMVGRWGELARDLKPEHVAVSTTKPERPSEVVFYNLELAKRGVDNLLREQFQIPGPMLMGMSPGAVVSHLSLFPAQTTMTVFHLSGISVELSMQIGVVLRSKPILNFAVSVAHTRLELLGYPRPVPEQLSAILADAQSPQKSERFLECESLLCDAVRMVQESAHFYAGISKDKHHALTGKKVAEILKVLRPD